MNKPDGKGLRFDEGKERVDLLPPDALMYLGKVYAMGAVKYGDRNWERGMPWSKVIAPLKRHLFRFEMGAQHDTESNLLHSAHVAWNALALLTYELRDIGQDDRSKVEQVPGVRPDSDDAPVVSHSEARQVEKLTALISTVVSMARSEKWCHEELKKLAREAGCRV